MKFYWCLLLPHDDLLKKLVSKLFLVRFYFSIITKSVLKVKTGDKKKIVGRYFLAYFAHSVFSLDLPFNNCIWAAGFIFRLRDHWLKLSEDIFLVHVLVQWLNITQTVTLIENKIHFFREIAEWIVWIYRKWTFFIFMTD